MYVCLCNGITDTQIRAAVEGGASSLRQLRAGLGVASQCGQCQCLAGEIISEALDETGNGPQLCYAAG